MTCWHTKHECKSFSITTTDDLISIWNEGGAYEWWKITASIGDYVYLIERENDPRKGILRFEGGVAEIYIDNVDHIIFYTKKCKN